MNDYAGFAVDFRIDFADLAGTKAWLSQGQPTARALLVDATLMAASPVSTSTTTIRAFACRWRGLRRLDDASPGSTDGDTAEATMELSAFVLIILLTCACAAPSSCVLVSTP